MEIFISLFVFIILIKQTFKAFDKKLKFKEIEQAENEIDTYINSKM